MGAGDKFQVSIVKGFGLAVYVERWPHQLSVSLLIGCISIYLGFGKGYHEL